MFCPTIRFINKKVWIQQNNTEFNTNNKLILREIEKQYLVLGFIALNRCSFTVFFMA